MGSDRAAWKTRTVAGLVGLLALAEIALVGAGLIARHEREFDKGLAPVWPVRLYVATGIAVVLVLVGCLYELRREWRGEKNLALLLCGIGTGLVPVWAVLGGLAYAS